MHISDVMLEKNLANFINIYIYVVISRLDILMNKYNVTKMFLQQICIRQNLSNMSNESIIKINTKLTESR